LIVGNPWAIDTGMDPQTSHPKGKTYREAQLGLRELVHFIMVEHAPGDDLE
jgi:hypothetical protein